MIVTLTANPSLDRTIELPDALHRGAVQRAIATHDQPGGKGVNVSRALVASAVESTALLPGDPADPMVVALRDEGIPSTSLPISGRIRSNVTLTEPDGTTTKINEPGPTLGAAEADALVDLVVAHAAHAEWLVLAGSLPPGLPVDFYARVVRAVRAAGDSPPFIAVDSSGAPFAALLDSGVGVDLVKPNAEELSEATGSGHGDSLESDPLEAYAAARTLLDRGCAAVLATLGSKGAVLVTREGGWLGAMPPIVPRSTVGAGDASLAGYLVAALATPDPTERLAQAIAHGSAATSLPGSTMPSLDQTHPRTAIIRSLTTITADR